MKIYCCKCEKIITARLTTGTEIYPHRPDLGGLPFWICDTCRNYVGTHYKTKNRTQPLGVIPTDEIRQARKQIHAIFDILLKTGKISRKNLYATISEKFGREYHTADIRNIEEVERIIDILKELNKL